MSTNEVHSNGAAGNAGAARIDMKLEVVVIPVSDVERSKEFYGRIGWRLDIDRSADEDFRLVQFRPPGSRCSIQATLLSEASPIIAGAIKEEKLKVVPARYDIASHTRPLGCGTSRQPVEFETSIRPKRDYVLWQ